MSGRGIAIFVGAREPTIPANNWPSQKPAPAGILWLIDRTWYDNASGTLMVKALKPLKLKKIVHYGQAYWIIRLSESALNLIQGISPLSFIDLRTASVSFRLVTQLKTLMQLYFQAACHPVKSTTPNPANKGIKYWCPDETRLGLKTIESRKITAFRVKSIDEVNLFESFDIFSDYFADLSSTFSTSSCNFLSE